MSMSIRSFEAQASGEPLRDGERLAAGHVALGLTAAVLFVFVLGVVCGRGVLPAIRFVVLVEQGLAVFELTGRPSKHP
jgi:hypothetical protein